MDLDNPMNHFVTSGLQNYKQPINLPFELPTRIYGCMLIIWLLRPHLQQKFPLHKNRPIDYLRFLAWCVLFGRSEYAILRELDKWDAELYAPIQLPRTKMDQWGGTFCVGIYLIGIARNGFSLAPMLSSPIIRNRVATWYWRGGRQTSYLIEIPQWQYDYLMHLFGSSQNFFRYLLKKKKYRKRNVIKCVYESNKDVLRGLPSQIQFDALSPKPPKISLLTQFSAFVLSGFWKKIMQLLPARITPPPSLAEISQVIRHINLNRQTIVLNTSLYPFGVNLFGYANGELGIGEDVRMLAHALHEAQIPFCVVNIKPGKDVSQCDNTIDNWLSERPQYAINIFCMTGIEYTRLICEQGSIILNHRYNIGLWPWELPEWPESWHHAWNGIQEIWGISQFTSKAYHRAPVQVRTMPLPVQIDKISSHTRRDFRLPEDAYLFIFSFDFNSTLTRKNPAALIAAFIEAFPPEMTDVGLVIKVHHARANDPQWQKIKRQILSDSRIHLVEQSLRKHEVLALYKCCNCFVSLHRSEGFGRSIAEAMLLNMEVITTGFSGNMDFCTQEKTELVDFKIRPLTSTEYFFSEGQRWAEPNVEHAAVLMRKVYNRHHHQSVSPSYDTTQFSTSYCGEQYKQRLKTIWQKSQCRLSPE
ncbi:glycosyltransferase [Legionella longbeachae]|uniref:glycosyltransferase n=1 Tax=Legionella longbeachae TaxID=450 RepID=UPI001246ECCB|nr:glycosyltransferase [Legionella longbeachae]QEY52870.1 glycosyltransferase family 4 protein [Legionella longbeachae]